ncbi:MAG: hypothetical protein AB7H96_20920 [Vicinamibacterales bacterium]
MHAFIVRPFGIKDVVIGGKPDKMDFDRVERELIAPALQGAKMEGGTTAEIVEQGNIREDMFRLLVTAPLVVADVSIHNANVFYELGIRHGLRSSDTFLLRADIDKFPFDLATDRYLIYDAKNPSAAVPELTRALLATRISDRVDSPVYQVLPSLRPPDPTTLNVVPRDFMEAVHQARASRYRGDLRLLAHEARDFDWAAEGLRAVGRAQFAIHSWHGAQQTFEWLQDLRPDDIEANQKLAEIYHKLSDMEEQYQRAEYLARSTAAIQRVIDAHGTTRTDRAEAYSLRGSNLRAHWEQDFARKDVPAARLSALRSARLMEALQAFASGFQQDLNHFESGLSAMVLLRLRIELAKLLPEDWKQMFETDAEAQTELERSELQFQQLWGAVALSLQASRNAQEKQPVIEADERTETAVADATVRFLTGRRPLVVAQKFREALAEASHYTASAVREQLAAFEALQIRPEFVKEVLATLNELSGSLASETRTLAVRYSRVILFTGHTVDRLDRPVPRFPRSAAAEQEARRLIKEALLVEMQKDDGPLLGISSGRCGGDILFHEVCAELNIDTRMFLPLPVQAFSARSVQHGGAHWVDRFEKLVDTVKFRQLSTGEELPLWLQAKPYNVYQRHNLWMVFNARAVNARSLTLIALWDEGPADRGPGGTEDLVEQVQSRGHSVIRLPAERLKEVVA